MSRVFGNRGGIQLYYSVIGILALLVLVVENQDTLFKSGRSDKKPSCDVYRWFLMTVAVYYVSDILWGIFEQFKLAKLLFIDTSFYFVAMAVGVLFWTRYTVTYLEKKNAFAKFLVYSGRICAAAVTVLVIANCFIPVLFKVDENCVYHPLGVRYVALIWQIGLLLLISVNSFSSVFTGEKDKKYRFFALASFGLIMAVFLLAQIFYPYLPLYSVAYLLGTSIMRTFVISDERVITKKIVTKDALTGVGNKFAFDDVEKEMNKRIENGQEEPFLIVVCDINDLKIINDTKGHIVGDSYIQKACTAICNTFKHSRVFRIGGDEFIAICRGEDFENIDQLLKKMNSINSQNRKNGDVQIAYGMARFENDTDVQDVFRRADKKMYEQKMWLKAKVNNSVVKDVEKGGRSAAYKFPEGLKKAYESSPISFAYYQNIDGNPVPILVSDGFCKNTGLSREKVLEWLEKGMFSRIHPDDVDLVYKISYDFLNQKGSYDIIFRSQLGHDGYDPEFENDDEKYVQIHGTGKWQKMPDGTELAVITYANLSETQKAIHESIEVYEILKRDHFYTDPLTDLPNLNYLHEFGNEAVDAMRKRGVTPSVIYTDIYSIQSYNNRYGVKAGDNLICLVAGVLKEKFPKSIVARGSDDHFIVVSDVDDINEIEKLLHEANKKIINTAQGITTGIRSGVCPLDEKSTLISTIDRAKHTMKLIAYDMNREVEFFSEVANNDYMQERYIVENLNLAIEKGWIKVYYHAFYRVDSMKIAAFEGLARWVDPDRGVIAPDTFIPVLQKYHQLHKLDLCVFEQVCKEIKERYDSGLPLLPVSVNFSMQDFDYADVVGEMNALYEKYNLDVLVDKSYFIIEITEQDLAVGAEKIKDQFTQIRNNGYRLWLDDFGSGYSALNVFSQFDFDLIKFDMDLLRNLDSNGGINRVILKELVYLSRKFGIHTLIEGVETESQLSFVKEIGCELAQGYYFHKPESLDQILTRLKGGDEIKPCETPKERASYELKWRE